MELSTQLLFLIIIIIIHHHYSGRRLQLKITTTSPPTLCVQGESPTYRLLRGSLQYMLNFKKIAHIAVIASLSISYACFVIQLARSSFEVNALLILYCIILFVYTLQTYAAFHFPPTQPNIHTTNFDLNLIFSFKLTQERRRELQLALRECKDSSRRELEIEYINQHKKPSFCDVCERVQPPRAYHCLICDSCIMGKQKHSSLLGFCIGQNNEFHYLTYLLISKILYLYSFFSLAFIQLVGSNFQKLSSAFELYYFCLIFILVLLFAFYFREFIVLFHRMEANKTICEANDPFLTEDLAFESTKPPPTYWNSLKGMINLKIVGQSSSWLAEIQEEEV